MENKGIVENLQSSHEVHVAISTLKTWLTYVEGSWGRREENLWVAAASARNHSHMHAQTTLRQVGRISKLVSDSWMEYLVVMSTKSKMWILRKFVNQNCKLWFAKNHIVTNSQESFDDSVQFVFYFPYFSFLSLIYYSLWNVFIRE